MAIGGKKIVDFPNLGSSDDGEIIYFTLKTPSGDENTYILPHWLLRNLVAGLVKAEIDAQKPRAKTGNENEMAGGFLVNEIRTRADEKSPVVVFQMLCMHDFSLDFHIPVEVA